MRLLAFLLLAAQLAVVAHRIEHYIAPTHMECGEDSCVAFAPVTGAAEPPDFITPSFAVVFFVYFWAVHAPILRSPGARLGFRALAPPV